MKIPENIGKPGLEDFLLATGSIKPGETYDDFLKKTQIIEPDETWEDMIYRVSSAITEHEKRFGFSKGELTKFENKIQEYFTEGRFVPSTSILMNAGRNKDMPLGACAVVPIDLREDHKKIKNSIDDYHVRGMGTGFKFDDLENPIDMIMYLNEIAIQGEDNGTQIRPVGNMGLLRVDHPRIIDYINLKVDHPNQRWIFNFSVDLTEEFMFAAKNNRFFELRNGDKLHPLVILDDIANATYYTGDPGVIWMHRHDLDNTVPHLGKYTSTAPCAELAMPEGGTCQFAYINLLKHLNETRTGFDYDKLAETVYLTVRFLDDALEQSMKGLPEDKSREIMHMSRRIGIGVCGWADTLLALNQSYFGNQSHQLATDVVSFINYQSKLASVELAKQRGAFGAFDNPETKIKDNYYENRFGNKGSKIISDDDWRYLDNLVEQYGIRHCETIALPPTGRSSRVLGVSAQIEPYWNIDMTPVQEYVLAERLSQTGKSDLEIEDIIKAVKKKGKIGDIVTQIDMSGFESALEIADVSHIMTVAAFQEYVDASVSKTVNLPENWKKEHIRELIMISYEQGLKGISQYRNNSRKDQPERVTGSGI